MRYVPGTHTQEIAVHRDTFAENNQLSRGQELVVDVNEAEAVDVVLASGQIALHHGRIFHASAANRTDDRRIGLAIRYISPRMQQVSGVKTYCTLVSGEDRYGHFHLTEAPRGVMHPTDREMAYRAITAGGKFLFAATLIIRRLLVSTLFIVSCSMGFAWFCGLSQSHQRTGSPLSIARYL